MIYWHGFLDGIVFLAFTIVIVSVITIYVMNETLKMITRRVYKKVTNNE